MELFKAVREKMANRDQGALSDLIGWTIMGTLGIVFVAAMAYKVNHASERDKIGSAMLEAYKVKHHCVLITRPVQNQPQLVKCDNGQTTEQLLRRKVIGNTWR